MGWQHIAMATYCHWMATFENTANNRIYITLIFIFWMATKDCLSLLIGWHPIGRQHCDGSMGWQLSMIR